MADTVDTQVLRDSRDMYIVRLQNRSDGTGETNVVKVDKSTLSINGAEPTKLSLLRAVWSINGFSVRLSWDHTTDDELLTLAGNGILDLESIGGIPDPASTGGTGDVLLSTVGTTAGFAYDLTLWFRKIA